MGVAAWLSSSLTLPAQELGPPSPSATGQGIGNGSPEADAFFRAHARLFCLAVATEDWSLFAKWVVVVGSGPRLYQTGDLDGAAMRTSPDLTSHPQGDGGDEQIDEYTSDYDNSIHLDRKLWTNLPGGGVGFISRNLTAADAILAGALAHEVTHYDDEYTRKGGTGETPADKAAESAEEVEGADCELKILRLLLAGICVWPSELAAAAPDITARIADVTKFKTENGG
ncbi:MAG: hypothetical protein HZB39_08690 [Planctomycetes bacterium]|nr:hypothetical protein [Planctomycetota bacterium]